MLPLLMVRIYVPINQGYLRKSTLFTGTLIREKK
jgi:hypothetical protein